MINPARSWQLLEERYGREQNPLYRAQLATIVRHVKAERAFDVDAIMATVSQDAEYHIHAAAGLRVLRGSAEIRSFYEGMASRTLGTEYAVERVVVDNLLVVTEGPVRRAVPGKVLIDMGVATADPNVAYLCRSRSVVIWPFAEGGMLLLGEHIYQADADPPETIVRQQLRADEVLGV